MRIKDPRCAVRVRRGTKHGCRRHDETIVGLPTRELMWEDFLPAHEIVTSAE
jgi:hypothetical protein